MAKTLSICVTLEALPDWTTSDKLQKVMRRTSNFALWGQMPIRIKMEVDNQYGVTTSCDRDGVLWSTDYSGEKPKS